MAAWLRLRRKLLHVQPKDEMMVLCLRIAMEEERRTSTAKGAVKLLKWIFQIRRMQ